MDDQKIIALFLDRSEQAITELSNRYGGAVRNVARNILKDPQDAEECVMDTYHQVWNRIPPTVPKYLGAYVCRVARNLCLDRYDRNTAAKRNSYYDVALEELEGTVPALSTVESEYDAKVLTGHLNAFLEELSPENRYLFLRRYWHGDAVREIARQMGIAPHVATVRLSRLRKKLQEKLQKEGYMV